MTKNEAIENLRLLKSQRQFLANKQKDLYIKKRYLEEVESLDLAIIALSESAKIQPVSIDTEKEKRHEEFTSK